jgi:hypothetical protein
LHMYQAKMFWQCSTAFVNSTLFTVATTCGFSQNISLGNFKSVASGNFHQFCLSVLSTNISFR